MLVVVVSLCVLGVVWLVLPYYAKLVLIGGLITAGFSWYFYQRASSELKAEAATLWAETRKLRQLTKLSMRGQEEMRKSDMFTQDDYGDFTGGLKVKRTAHGTIGRMGGSAHVSGQDAQDPRRS